MAMRGRTSAAAGRGARGWALIALLAALSAGGPGCLLTSHMPYDDDPAHLAIRWRPDFAAAAREAEAEAKPLLAVIAAGDITGNC